MKIDLRCNWVEGCGDKGVGRKELDYDKFYILCFKKFGFNFKGNRMLLKDFN